jgi:hypothetical protein
MIVLSHDSAVFSDLKGEYLGEVAAAAKLFQSVNQWPRRDVL